MRGHRGLLAMLAVALAVTAGLAGAPAARSDTAVSDLVVGLRGPDQGQAGETLSYVVTIFTLGPYGAPATTMRFSFDGGVFQAVGYTASGSCTLAGTTYTCDVPETGRPGEWIYTFDLRIVSRAQTRLSAFVDPGGSNDPDLANNTMALDVLGPPTEFENTSPPTLSGEATVGSTLTATPGSWSPSYPYSYAYHWVRCDASTCATQSADGSTYSITAGDAGCSLKVIVTATAGNRWRTVGSAQTPVVQPGGTCTLHPVAGGGSTPPPPLVAAAPTFTLRETPLPQALTLQPYVAEIARGPEFMSFLVVAGALPVGLGFGGGGGGGTWYLSGIPRGIGTYTFTILAKDSGAVQYSVQREYTLVVTAPREAAAVVQRGTLSGQVRDAKTHAPVRASVTLKPLFVEPEAKSATVVAARGVYRFASLPYGRYRLTVRARGYATSTRIVSLSAASARGDVTVRRH